MAAHQVYMPAKNGPFRCDMCAYYPRANRCRHPEIVKLLGAVESGLAKVDAGGCSDYFEPRERRSVAERVRN